jgi:hypothetical protein
MRRSGADLQVTYKLIEQRSITNGLNLHIAVVQIFHIPAQTERFRLSRGVPAVTDTLN